MYALHIVNRWEKSPNNKPLYALIDNDILSEWVDNNLAKQMMFSGWHCAGPRCIGCANSEREEYNESSNTLQKIIARLRAFIDVMHMQVEKLADQCGPL